MKLRRATISQKLAALFAACFTSAGVFAADSAVPQETPQPPGYRAAKDAETDNFKLPPLPAQDALDAGLAEPGADPPEATLLVQRVEIETGPRIDATALRAIAAPVVGKPLSAIGIEALRQRLTRALIAEGFVNSGVLLDAAASRDGVLRFTVIEGHVQAVRARGLDRLDPRYLSSRLVQSDQELFNMQQLRERFARLLDDPLIAQMNARLLPGDAPGQAILDIDVVRAAPYQLEIGAGNTRPPSIGENTLALSGVLRNLSGWGDQLDAGVQASARDGSGLRGNLGWRIPFNAGASQASLQWDHGQSAVVEEPLRALGITSRIDARELGLSHTLRERPDGKLSIGLARVWRENRSALLGEPFSFSAGETDGVTRIRSWRFWQEFSYRAVHQVLALRSTLSSATSNLDDAVAGAPARNYTVWQGQAQYARQMESWGQTQFVARLTLQHSNAHLPALDQLSVGGAASVRGYRENQLVRDRGAVLNLEMDIPLLRAPTPGLQLALLPFYDLGRARNQGENDTVLSSAGLAGRLRWQGWKLDLAVAKRLRHPDTVNSAGGTLQDRGVHLRVAYELLGR